MEEAHEDGFVVYVRSQRDRNDPPEESEWAAVACASYEEACRVRQLHRLHDRDCVIRFVGTSGGGD
jgi:hypothetical protein